MNFKKEAVNRVFLSLLVAFTFYHNVPAQNLQDSVKEAASESPEESRIIKDSVSSPDTEIITQKKVSPDSTAFADTTLVIDSSQTSAAPLDSGDSVISTEAVESAADTMSGIDSALVLDSSSTGNKIDSALVSDSSSANVPEVNKDTLGKKVTPLLKKKKPARKKVFKESRINTINDMKGRYKSPKKAMFMSLALPGLGQAYVGHYVRGAAYLLIDVALGVGWHHYVVVKHDRQVVKYRNYADAYWSHKDYERLITDEAFDYFENEETREQAFRMRESFCDAVYPPSEVSTRDVNTCKFIGLDEAVILYEQMPHRGLSNNEPSKAGERGTYRKKNYQDLHEFYELIGKYDEFVLGWNDLKNQKYDSTITGSSANRLVYRDMRLKATEYSKMQTLFLGGILLNHLVSALDAAISARFNNKKLYQTEVKWYERIHLESFFAFSADDPFHTVKLHLLF